jgi:hypothetical protein
MQRSRILSWWANATRPPFGTARGVETRPPDTPILEYRIMNIMRSGDTASAAGPAGYWLLLAWE